MLTKGAVEDLIMRHISREPEGAAFVVNRIAEIKKKVFLSDWELRRIYKPGSKTVQISADSIVSPLSLDWLEYDGITVVRDGLQRCRRRD